MGKATPKPGYKDKEPRDLPPTLLRTCYLTEKTAAPLRVLISLNILGQLAWAGEPLQ